MINKPKKTNKPKVRPVKGHIWQINKWTYSTRRAIYLKWLYTFVGGDPLRHPPHRTDGYHTVVPCWYYRPPQGRRSCRAEQRGTLPAPQHRPLCRSWYHRWGTRNSSLVREGMPRWSPQRDQDWRIPCPAQIQQLHLIKTMLVMRVIRIRYRYLWLYRLQCYGRRPTRGCGVCPKAYLQSQQRCQTG